MSFTNAIRSLGVLCCLTQAVTAAAETRTSTVHVSVTIVNDCNVATARSANEATVTLACSSGTPYTVVVQHAAVTQESVSGPYRVIDGRRAGSDIGGMGDGSSHSVRIRPVDVRGNDDRVIATIWY